VIPRLSRRAGFWAVAFAFLVVTAFSTAPSSLYGLYEHRDHLSSLTITFVYAVYAAGVVTSLVLAGHVSDWYGRRVVLLPAIGIAIVAAVVLLVWRSLGGLVLARILTGFGVGAAVATATAFITDLDTVPGGGPTRPGRDRGDDREHRRSGLGSADRRPPRPLRTALTDAAVSGLPSSPCARGDCRRACARRALAHTPSTGLSPSTPVGSGERAPAVHRCHRWRVLCFAASGLFLGLAAVFLAGPLHHPSPALCGLAIFVTFGSGVVVQTTTTNWPAHRLIAAGIIPTLIGLGVIVASAWTSPPSLALFLIGGIIVGAGSGAIFRGTLTVVISTSGSEDRAGALTSFFTAGFIGLSVPIVGLGVALQHLSPEVTLLLFGVVVGLGILAAAPVLVRPLDANSRRGPNTENRTVSKWRKR
jgi:MFS family permease